MKKDFIPLLVSLILCLASIVIVLTMTYTVDYRYYIGFGLLAASTFLYFSIKNVYFYVFGLTLLAGLFGIIDFFIFEFGIGIAGISLNPIFLVIGIIFVNQHKARIFVQSKEKKPVDNSASIERFKTKYESKTENELRDIADPESQYVEEARIAARLILGEKNVL